MEMREVILQLEVLEKVFSELSNEYWKEVEKGGHSDWVEGHFHGLSNGYGFGSQEVKRILSMIKGRGGE